MSQKARVSTAQLLKIANDELKQQPFYRAGDEITEAKMVGPWLTLGMPSERDDFHVIEKEYQAFAHSLALRYEIVG